MDDKTFFREATLRICGNLEIETALWRCFLYLADFIPATEVYLNYYDHNLGAIRFYAMANAAGGKRLNVHIPLPIETRTLIEQNRLPDIVLINEADEHPITRQVKHIMGFPDFSTILMHLEVGEMSIGRAAFPAIGKNCYTPEHLRLLSLLKEPFAIALSNSLRFQQVLDLKELLAEDNRFLRDELRRASGEDVIGADSGLKHVMEMVRQVAPLSSPVLLLGETGAGKEVIANAVHNLSFQKDGPFIKVNCGAIAESLMDSELFGHEKGAFTGAISRKRGRFERAHGGTIFLDEVGELSAAAQVRLLRVLQEKEIERVGGTTPIRVNIRVIAATHRNLEQRVGDGNFRQDLYYRLRVFPVTIPPIRDRKSDIPALVHHFVRKKAREMGLPAIPAIAPGAIDFLMSRDWPGNVREIENAVERAMILSGGKPLSFEFLEFPFSKKSLVDSRCDEGEPVDLDTAMFRHIRKILDLTGGKVGGKQGAAQILGINPSTLRHRMRKQGIPFGRKREMSPER